MTENKTNSSDKKKKRKKKNKNFIYFYLFVIVFIFSLVGLTHVVNSYSPEIDVSIGNTENMTLNDSDMDVEIKSVDERLKWIQMEDEMPTVALRNPESVVAVDEAGDVLPSVGSENIEQLIVEDDNNKQKNIIVSPSSKPKVVVDAPLPTIRDIKVSNPDFRSPVAPIPQNTRFSGPVPLPTKTSYEGFSSSIEKSVPKISRVYLGSFSTLEEAMEIQKKINAEDSSISPFIKATNGEFFVQLGSFSDESKATAMVIKLRDMGYSPKINKAN